MVNRNAFPLAATVLVATVVAALTSAQEMVRVPVSSLGHTCQLIGRTGQPIGAMVTVEGVVIEEDRWRDNMDGPLLQLQKVNGRASQDCIEIPIRPFSSGFGEPFHTVDLDSPIDPTRSLPKLEYGQTYEFWGYETGGFEGGPFEAGTPSAGDGPSLGFGFRSAFLVVKAKKVRPIAFSPADFLGRKALVHGTATNHDGKAWLTGKGWQIEVLRLERGPWPDALKNSRLAIIGEIGKEPNAKFPYIAGLRVWRDHLEDQIGQHVELRGEAVGYGDRWLLNCNEQYVMVENMDHLVAVQSIEFRAPIEVRGILRVERLPDLVHYDDKGKQGKPKEQYIVREATCRALEGRLPVERIGEPNPWSIGATPVDRSTPKK